MKNLIFAVVIFLVGLVSLTESKSENVRIETLDCDYWSEIVEIAGTKWLYEYCGDKMIMVTPLFDED